MVIGRLVRYGRRQLHTIVSREIIKPSSPTPSHLKTHNLSLMDQLTANSYMPMVTFYPNSSIYPSSRDKALDLKKSLSQVLTQYYPFAGRHAKTAPIYVDCNDDGAEFLEALIHSSLSDFLQKSQHEDLDQLFPDRRVWHNSNHRSRNVESDKAIPLSVQVNHFTCGGVAVAVLLSHKIGDGSSLARFFSDWAAVTQSLSGEEKVESPIHPQFLLFERRNINFPGFSLARFSDESVTRSFVFPNSKLNELKSKLTAQTMESGQPITNPTRVEALNWLLYKRAAEAVSINNSGSFKPIGMGMMINLRDKMVEPLPVNSIGNLYTFMEILTNNESEMKPEIFIGQIKKQKMEIRGVKNLETVFEILSTMYLETGLQELQKKLDNSFMSTSMCGYPVYKIDFGWGKPVKVTLAGNIKKNSFLLMDTPNRDGIEALVCLGKEDMATMQSDPELLAFC